MTHMLKPTPNEIERGLNAKQAPSASHYAKALQEYRPLAEQGHAFAQFRLGMMYRKGQGVLRDDAEAAKWYRLAAEQGNADAQFHLGIMYRKGQGVPQDKSEAAKWYQLAAEQVNPENPTTPHKDISTCRTRLLGGTDLVECLIGEFSCQWAVPFGYTNFCKHPSAGQFVNSTQP